MSGLIVQTTAAPSATPSHPVTPNMLAPTTFASYVENADTRMWTAYLQLLQMYLDHPTGELKDIVGVLESESQECNGGNVMVMENPLYFSYFPSISPSFSFDDFVSYASLDVHMD